MTGTIRRLSLIIFAVTTLALGGAATRAQESLKIQISGHYFAEPATVDVLVAVEPNKDNRTLRLEADGDSFFRSSELELTGDTEQRFHNFMFKNIPAGEYVVRAVLLSGTRELAMAQTNLSVLNK